MPTNAHGKPPAIRALLGKVHLDDGCRITEADAAFRETFARSSGTPLGVPLSQFFREEGEARLRAHFSELLEGRQFMASVPLTMVDRDGETVDCLVTCASLVSSVHLRCTECTVSAAIVRDTAGGRPTVLLPTVILPEIPAHILEGLACGLSTQQLASQLNLSSRGVEYHISNMLRALKAPNRSALVARAYTLGILAPQHWPPHVRPLCTTRGLSPHLTDHTPLPATSA